jgi:hypothetical protein
MAVSRVVPNNVAGAAAIHSFHYSITALHHDPCFTAPLMLCYRPNSTVLPTYTCTNIIHPNLIHYATKKPRTLSALGEWRTVSCPFIMRFCCNISFIFKLFRPVPRRIAAEEVQQKDKHSNRLYHYYTIT